MGIGTVVLSCTYTGNYFKDLVPGRVNRVLSRQSGIAREAFVFLSGSTTHGDPPGVGDHPVPILSATTSSCFELCATLTSLKHRQIKQHMVFSEQHPPGSC